MMMVLRKEGVRKERRVEHVRLPIYADGWMISYKTEANVGRARLSRFRIP